MNVTWAFPVGKTMSKTKLASCVVGFLFLCNFTLGQPATTQTHPLYPLNIGDKWTYRSVDLKTPAGKKEAPKKTVVEVAKQEVYTHKVTKEGKTVESKHVGFVLKSSSGSKEKFDHVVILDDGVHVIRRAKTEVSPPP